MSRLLFACSVTLLLSLAITPVQAGKLYKIVDKDGNVTFSQFPPQPQEQQDMQVDTVSLSTSSSTHLSRNGKTLRCGSIELPKVDKTDPVKMLELEELRAEWQQELESDTDLRDVTWRMQLSRYNIRRDPAESGQVKRDLECAIKWVDSQKGDVAEARQQLQERSRSLDQRITKLKAERDRKCGTEPYRNPNEPATMNQWQRWRECYYDNSEALYELESEAQSLKAHR